MHCDDFSRYMALTGEFLRHRRISLFDRVARLDPGLEYQHMLFWRRPTGFPRTYGLTMSRRMPPLHRCLRCGDLRSPEATERRNGPFRFLNEYS